jgi:hypothetical protein
MSIPTNANFLGLSCQLGGLKLNGIAGNGTAKSLTVLSIDDTNATMFTPVDTISPQGYLRIAVGSDSSGSIYYYLPVYQ